MKLGLTHVAAVALVSLTVFGCGTTPADNEMAQAAGGAGATHTAHPHGGPPPSPAPLRDGERFHQISVERPYRPTPPEGSTDEYRCFLLDSGLDEAAFITGTQVLPQTGLVHHANVSRVDASVVEHARKLDAADEGDGWRCFGGTGLEQGVGEFGGESSSETYLGGWSPGHNETLVGDPAGYPIKPGSHIVLQVHFSLLGFDGGPVPSDQPSIRLRLMPGSADVRPLKALLLPAPIELPCGAAESGPLCDRGKAIEDLVKRTGPQAKSMVEQLNKLCNGGAPPAAGPTQHCDFPVRESVLLYGVGPHMHLLGRSIKVELNPGAPDARTLLDQPVYNFDNQAIQVLPQPIRINPGDTVRVTCTHDATLRSKLPQLRSLQPRYVVWGDGTSDEMCLGLLSTTNKL
jgi:hypothetical protein